MPCTDTGGGSRSCRLPERSPHPSLERLIKAFAAAASAAAACAAACAAADVEPVPCGHSGSTSHGSIPLCTCGRAAALTGPKDDGDDTLRFCSGTGADGCGWC